MCTLSWIPLDDRIIVTGNRDEDPVRAGLSNMRFRDDDFIFLLNGGFEKHERKTPYAASRSTVIDAIWGGNDIILDGIEPFTLITHLKGQLTETVWDGETQHTKEHDKDMIHLWASCTLYTANQKWQKYKALMDARWEADPTEEDMFEIHQDDFKYRGEHKNIKTIETRQITIKL